MKAIIACDTNGGIGYQNKLPWSKIQGDLPRFRSLTEGQIVVMGRNTWESLPKKPLIGRLNFIVSSSSLLSLPFGAIQVTNLNHFGEFKNAWLIGGAKLFNSGWHMIDEIHLTKTFAEYTCDTYIDLAKIKSEFTWEESSYNKADDHIYQVWKRK